MLPAKAENTADEGSARSMAVAIVINHGTENQSIEAKLGIAISVEFVIEWLIAGADCPEKSWAFLGLDR